MALSEAARRKLVGVLGRLGSDYDGERSAAALLASRMLREAGLQWDDLIWEPETSRRRDLVPLGWRGELALAQRHISFCRPWERDFVQSISCRTKLSEKQQFILSEIAAGLRNRGKA